MSLCVYHKRYSNELEWKMVGTNSDHIIMDADTISNTMPSMREIHSYSQLHGQRAISLPKSYSYHLLEILHLDFCFPNLYFSQPMFSSINRLSCAWLSLILSMYISVHVYVPHY